MFLFGPPDIEKLKAKRDINGLKKALEYKNDERVQSEAARALDELGYHAEASSSNRSDAHVSAIPPSISAGAVQTAGSFSMKVEDVFFIRGRGTVVTGQIAQGTISEGDQVIVTGPGGSKRLTVTGIEMFRKIMKTAKAGDNVGLLFKDATKDDLHAGDQLDGLG